MNVQAVIFDWGGTLTPWHTIDPYECWYAVTGDDEAATALHAAETAVWAAVREEHRSGTFEQILDQAQHTLSAEQRRRYYEWWDAHTYTDPAVPELFQALRARGLKIGVLSNTTWPAVEHERIFQRDAVHQLIDGAVYSSELPWTKPHPEAFLAAMAAVGVSDPSRAVYVGDRLFEDIYGANRVGMRAVLLPHSTIPAAQLGIDGTPDAVIADLVELVGVIDGWLAQ
ncbi:MAG: HAD family hydrolase [Actinomycetota bacterium]|nr:HAD family hydrolase [Actinomycetota bacterium]MDQ2957658.1 HAD family hydrolase [Actinomycetota bacterium]